MDTLIKHSIDINASKAKVWDVLTKDQYNRIWYAFFSEGTHAETDWSQGSKVIFKDDSNSGMIAEVTAAIPGELLAVKYTGILMKGKEDYDSKDAQSVKTGYERYEILEKDGKVKFYTEAEMGPEMEEMLSEPWKNALNKIKELAESI
ncbi:MAG: SRPBCC domain-containing protein [Cytophagales bacterium]|nr:SRPBCC domain-containing protein [Cytophaga sp.]